MTALGISLCKIVPDSYSLPRLETEPVKRFRHWFRLQALPSRLKAGRFMALRSVSTSLRHDRPRNALQRALQYCELLAQARLNRHRKRTLAIMIFCFATAQLKAPHLGLSRRRRQVISVIVSPNWLTYFDLQGSQPACAVRLRATKSFPAYHVPRQTFNRSEPTCSSWQEPQHL